MCLLAAFHLLPCRAADRFWVGGTSSEWTNTLNWSLSSGGGGGATVPLSGDRAWFDGGSASDCLMNANGVVDQLILSNTFARVLDLGTNNLTITYAAGNGRLYAGGGEIRLGTGTLALYGDLYAAGATITPQSSTVNVYAYFTTTPSSAQMTELIGSCELNHVRFVNGGGGASVYYAAVTNGTLTVNGTLTLDGRFGSNGYQILGGGEIRARGKVTRNSAINADYTSGNVRLTIDGSSGDQIQDTLLWAGGNYTVNKPAGTLVCTNVTSFGGGARTYTFNSPVNFTSNLTRAEFWMNGGYVSQAIAGSVDPNFYDLDLRGDQNTGYTYLDLSNQTVTVNRNCWAKLDTGGGHDRKINNGTLDIKGNLTLLNTPSSGRTQGSALVRMSGPSNATLRSGDAGTNTYFNNLVIAKSGGASVTLISDLGIIGASGTNLWVQSGVLDAAGSNINAGAFLRVDDTLRLKGRERIYGATTNSLNTNSSTLVFYDAAVAVSMSNFFAKSFYNLTLGAGKTNLFGTGTVNRVIVNGALGSDGSEGNRSVLRSAVDGTPWYLTLAGASLLTNRVDVKDSDASAGSTVLALGALDSANNVNWKFVTDDTPIIRNVTATNIATTSADLVGNLLQGLAPVEVTCYWGTSDGGTNPLAWAASTNLGMFLAAGQVTNSIPSGVLQTGTAYFYTFYASNSVAGVWANYGSRFFSTYGVPVVDNDGGATAIGQTNATLRGTLTVGDPGTAAWIYWGTSDGGTNKGDWDRPAISIGLPGLATFAAPTNGLLANQSFWYRCYASNSYGDAWAPASSNFTTLPPALVINDLGVLEGVLGTTNYVAFTLTLSATSVVPVSVNFATADGTATVADRDYVATNGTLTIPAGSTTGSITVGIVGDNKYELDETFYVNLTVPVGVTVADAQGFCAITNDDLSFYVRGDGLGSDTTNFGSAWNDAFATLQKAVNTVPPSANNVPGNHGAQTNSTPRIVYVQGSVGAQAYDVAARQVSAFDVEFQGGWMNVDSAPVQTGMSLVRDQDGTVDEAGIYLTESNHGQWRRIVINRIVFTNVTRGVDITSRGSIDSADIWLMVSNTTVYARTDGLYVSYPRTAITGYGGLTSLTADTVRVFAGLGGAPGAHGVAIYSPWQGMVIGASGVDPLTGAPNVSTITSSNGCGVYFLAGNPETDSATFSNLVVYASASNGIALASAGPVRGILQHCTVADNGRDGLNMRAGAAGSWASVTNSIFANNADAGVSLGTNAGVTYTCTENYNVFFNDNVLTNGAAPAPGANTATSDPLFYAQKAKPAPWYLLSSGSSPAYRRASDGANRGAYQYDNIAKGTVLLSR